MLNLVIIKLYKTPVLKNRKTHIFKNHINKKLNIDNEANKSKENMMENYLSSFSIKVNKTTLNKDKENKIKNKNLKKTWNKNLKNISNHINNNNLNEIKK